MASTLPGLSLPGLGFSQTGSSTTPANLASSGYSQPSQSRKEDLPPRSEWRFEVSFHQTYTIRLIAGHAEIFGAELAPNHEYRFSGFKAAVLTWQGCQLEISGEAESEYLGLETEYAVEWLNMHGMLETVRDESGEGPRVLVVGPESVGKSSLVRSLAGWASRSGRGPTVVNCDPREGLLAPSGSLTSVTVGKVVDVESGYGISPISGPTLSSVMTPLVYHYPYASPNERPEVYKSLITRTALSVMSKMEEDPASKQSGLIADTPGSLNDPRTNYDQLRHIVSELSITLILSLGSERLFNDLKRLYGGSGSIPQREDSPTVLRISKPGGAVERDVGFMKTQQQSQIRQYFFGNSKDTLNPHSHTLNFADLAIYRATSADSPSDTTLDFERVQPSNEMLGRLLAIKFCAGESDEITLRDSAVMGFAYVSEVDEAKKRVRFLAPHPQRWGDRALVFGIWPEAVGDLVA